MGSFHSVKMSTKVANKKDDEEEVSSLELSGQQLGLCCDEVLTEIFSHIPDNDLLSNCRLVCKLWKEIIDSQSVWKIKAEQRRFLVPKLNDLGVSPPKHYYRTIAIKNPFGRNLITNPCGKAGLKGWIVTLNGGDRWRIEDPPNGADPLDTIEELNGHSSCFATSYAKCQKSQTVDLWKEGCTDDIMNQIKPRIYICEWYAARFDCSCQYNLNVKLISSDQNVIDSFKFEHHETQWTGRSWKKVEHVFKNCKGTRYIHFEHSGVDEQFWAGHYGSKMTNATVKIIVL